jgi:hypothetical protein
MIETVESDPCEQWLNNEADIEQRTTQLNRIPRYEASGTRATSQPAASPFTRT